MKRFVNRGINHQTRSRPAKTTSSTYPTESNARRGTTQLRAGESSPVESKEWTVQTDRNAKVSSAKVDSGCGLRCRPRCLPGPSSISAKMTSDQDRSIQLIAEKARRVLTIAIENLVQHVLQLQPADRLILPGEETRQMTASGALSRIGTTNRTAIGDVLQSQNRPNVGTPVPLAPCAEVTTKNLARWRIEPNAKSNTNRSKSVQEV